MFENLEIGSGSYGKVCFGLIKEPYKFTAIKIQNKEKVKKELFNKEIQILNRLNNINLFPKIISQHIGNNNYYIVQELQGPNLSKFLNFYFRIDKITLWNLAIELFSNIKILHENGVIH